MITEISLRRYADQTWAVQFGFLREGEQYYTVPHLELYRSPVDQAITGLLQALEAVPLAEAP